MAEGQYIRILCNRSKNRGNLQVLYCEKIIAYRQIKSNIEYQNRPGRRILTAVGTILLNAESRKKEKAQSGYYQNPFSVLFSGYMLLDFPVSG